MDREVPTFSELRVVVFYGGLSKQYSYEFNKVFCCGFVSSYRYIRSDPIDAVHTVFAITTTTSNKYSTYSIDSLSINTHTVVRIYLFIMTFLY